MRSEGIFKKPMGKIHGFFSEWKGLDFTKVGFSDTLVLMKWQGKLLSNYWWRTPKTLAEVWIKKGHVRSAEIHPQNDENEPWTLKSLQTWVF